VGSNPVELCGVVGCPPRECFVSADVLVSQQDRFPEGAPELVCRSRPPILAMPLVNSVTPPSILFC
jgi:hypothetical protein